MLKFTNKRNKGTRSERGQSLVEVALFFPIFIIMLAGLVEVANLLVTQNRVSAAARASTRFAADGGEDVGMVNVLLNNVTQTLSLEEDVWDVWSIRGRVNNDGDAIAEWEFTHIYGISNTVRYDRVDGDSIQTEVWNEIRLDENGNTLQSTQLENLRFVGTYAIHDIDSILGLDAMPGLVGYSSIRDMNIMRISGRNLEQTNGCTGFPIAVHEGIRSVTDPDAVPPGPYPYPDENDFTYPTNNVPTYESFVSHKDNVPFNEAEEGTVFKIQNGFEPGNFGWLVWNEDIPASSNTLANSLTWPGDSDDYTPLPNSPTGRGFAESGDPTDQSLHVGDWVAASTGSINSNAVRTALESNIDRGRTLRVIVWSDANEGHGVNGAYQISGFAIVRLIGYNLSQSGGGSWILAEFIRRDDSCGQVSPAGP